MTEPHNQAAARAWGHAGAHYDFISFGLSDGLSHAVQMLWPVPGERILDLATGTGWTARLAALQGAEVVGVDIAEGLLSAAQDLSAHLAPRLQFRQADAEALPFDDASFDAVISTYGVIFAGQPQRAAAELKRVIRPGGRMVLATWFDDAEDYIPAFFAMVGRYSDAPPPETSPMVWGNETWINETFGDDFDLEVLPFTTTLFAPDAETLWEKYRKGFGPMQLTIDALPPDQVEAFRRDFQELHAPYANGAGLKVDRKNLLVRGVRKNTAR